MIKVDYIDENGCIYFYSTEHTESVIVQVWDNEYQTPVYSTRINQIQPNTKYFISLQHTIIYYLRNTYIKFQTESNIWQEPINFPTELLKGFNLYGNSCVVWRTYEIYNTKYTSPTIGNLILDDEMFVRFCENIDTYLNVEMTFGDVRNNENFKKQTGRLRAINSNNPNTLYPISYHSDIDIHWIHAHYTKLQFFLNEDGSTNFLFGEEGIKPINIFKEKWESRVNRGQKNEKIFLWASCEFFNIHGDWERSQLIERFKKLPHRSIFLTERKEEEYEDEMHVVKYVPEWEGRHQLERDEGGGTLWNDQVGNAHRFKKIIDDKWNK